MSQNYHDLEITVKSQSRSLKVVSFCHCVTPLKEGSDLLVDQHCLVASPAALTVAFVSSCFLYSMFVSCFDFGCLT